MEYRLVLCGTRLSTFGGGGGGGGGGPAFPFASLGGGEGGAFAAALEAAAATWPNSLPPVPLRVRQLELISSSCRLCTGRFPLRR